MMHMPTTTPPSAGTCGTKYISPTNFGVGCVVNKIDRKGVTLVLVGEQRGLKLKMHIKWIVAIPLFHKTLEPRDQSSIFPRG